MVRFKSSGNFPTVYYSKYWSLLHYLNMFRHKPINKWLHLFVCLQELFVARGHRGERHNSQLWKNLQETVKIMKTSLCACVKDHILNSHMVNVHTCHWYFCVCLCVQRTAVCEEKRKVFRGTHLISVSLWASSHISCVYKCLVCLWPSPFTCGLTGQITNV